MYHIGLIWWYDVIFLSGWSPKALLPARVGNALVRAWRGLWPSLANECAEISWLIRTNPYHVSSCFSLYEHREFCNIDKVIEFLLLRSCHLIFVINALSSARDHGHHDDNLCLRGAHAKLNMEVVRHQDLLQRLRVQSTSTLIQDNFFCCKRNVYNCICMYT